MAYFNDNKVFTVVRTESLDTDKVGYFKTGTVRRNMTADEIAQVKKDMCFIEYMYSDGTPRIYAKAYSSTSGSSTTYYFKLIYPGWTASGSYSIYFREYTISAQVGTSSGYLDFSFDYTYLPRVKAAFNGSQTLTPSSPLNISISQNTVAFMVINGYFSGQWSNNAFTLLVNGSALGSSGSSWVSCPIIMQGDDNKYIQCYSAKVLYNNGLFILVADGSNTLSEIIVTRVVIGGYGQ